NSEYSLNQTPLTTGRVGRPWHRSKEIPPNHHPHHGPGLRELGQGCPRASPHGSSVGKSSLLPGPQRKLFSLKRSPKALPCFCSASNHHDFSRNFPMERVSRPWQGLPREVWSAHPWRCPRKGWRWHSGLWAGDKVGIWHRLDLMTLEVFSNLRDSGIYSMAPLCLGKEVGTLPPEVPRGKACCWTCKVQKAEHCPHSPGGKSVFPVLAKAAEVALPGSR
uniref:Uncharacterized protein n=1 Tax=Cyanoderma ruficeps TaxID=181631 RepID=A0A8C3RFI3_9PASS